MTDDERAALVDKVARRLAPVWFDPETYTGVGCRMAVKEAEAILAIVEGPIRADERARVVRGGWLPEAPFSGHKDHDE